MDGNLERRSQVRWLGRGRTSGKRLRGPSFPEWIRTIWHVRVTIVVRLSPLPLMLLLSYLVSDFSQEEPRLPRLHAALYGLLGLSSVLTVRLSITKQ